MQNAVLPLMILVVAAVAASAAEVTDAAREQAVILIRARAEAAAPALAIPLRRIAALVESGRCSLSDAAALVSIASGGPLADPPVLLSATQAAQQGHRLVSALDGDVAPAIAPAVASASAPASATRAEQTPQPASAKTVAPVIAKILIVDKQLVLLDRGEAGERYRVMPAGATQAIAIITVIKSDKGVAVGAIREDSVIAPGPRPGDEAVRE